MKQRNAEQSKAKQSKAEQSGAEQSGPKWMVVNIVHYRLCSNQSNDDSSDLISAKENGAPDQPMSL